MRAALLLLALGGCLRSLPGDGSLRCNHAGRLCPSGFYCEPISDSCWRNGNAPDGGGMKHPGNPCVDGDPCQCVDGYCCDDLCQGQCQACDVTPGTCANVMGPPHGARAACSGSGACGAVCDGSSATACAYPTSATPCGPSCSGGCDGAGSCGPGMGALCPNGFACGSDQCLSSCGGDGDCQPFFHCLVGSCVRLPESDCLDGIDNNGDGLADCADPTCVKVVCVPDPGMGALGAFVPSASPSPSCVPEFGTPLGLHLTPVAADGCANCSCNPSITCSVNVGISPSDATCAATNVYSISTSDAAQTCTAVPSQTVDYMITPAAPTVTSASCAGTGSTKPSPAAWAVSQGFCLAARQSSTCAAGQICVPRPSPGGALCLELPGAAAACPAGWSGGSGVTWYQNFSDTRACAACTCTSSGGSCPSWRVSQATTASGSCVTLIDTQVVTNFCEQNLSGASTVSALALQLYSPTEPTCKVNPGTGTVTPSGGVTICCPSCACANPPCTTPACAGGSYCDGATCRFCGEPSFCGPSCLDCTPRGDSCTSGVCKCGANAECDARTTDNCTGGQCRCGASQPCFTINSDSCTGGQCRCGAGPACNPATSNSCSGGQCRCGAQLCNDQIATSCTSGICRCGVNPACTGAQHCINNACQ